MSRPALSNMIVTRHMWLLQFTLIRIKYNLELSFSVALAIAEVLSSPRGLRLPHQPADTARSHICTEQVWKDIRQT